MACNFSKIWMDACRACANACQSLITTGNKYNTSPNDTELAQEWIAKNQACIQACKKSIEENTKHMRTCDDKACDLGCKLAAGVCNACIKACEHCLAVHHKEEAAQARKE